MTIVPIHYSTQDLVRIAEEFLKRPKAVEVFKSQGNSASRRRSFLKHFLQRNDGVANTRQVERLSRAIAAALDLPEGEHLNPRSQDLTKDRIPPLILNTEGKHMPYLGNRVLNIRLRGLTEAQFSQVRVMVLKHQANYSVTMVHKTLEVFIDYIKDLELPDQLLAFAKLHELQYDATIESAERLPTFAFGRLENSTPNLQQIPKKDNTMSTPITITKKDNTMSTPITITTKTLINDQDAARYTDAELYELIRKEEVKIEELGRIKNKPKKLVAEIESRTAGIQKLVEFMNNRDEKSAA